MMKRPIKEDKHILTFAFEDIAKSVIVWAKEEVTDIEVENTVKHLVKAYDCGLNADGYSMAKELEDQGYSPDSELVEILDGTFHAVYEFHRQAVKDWVTLYNIKPHHAIGANVKIKYKRKEVDGEIVKIDLDHAQYTVFVESEGHVREGVGTHGTIVNYEDVL